MSSAELQVTVIVFNEVFFMSCMIVSLGMSFVGLFLSYLILKEFKIANNKSPCQFSEKLLQDLIKKIDKVMVNDKVESA